MMCYRCGGPAYALIKAPDSWSDDQWGSCRDHLVPCLETLAADHGNILLVRLLHRPEMPD